MNEEVIIKSNNYDYPSSTCFFYDSTSSDANNCASMSYYANVLKIEQKSDDKGKYSIFDIANWFLLKQPMTNKKLQKMCYYAQAWFYALKNQRLINSDFEAWRHGPVSPVLNAKFKVFGYDTIVISKNFISHIDKDDEKFLNDIWETYGDKTGNALEVLSHSEEP